MHLNLKVPFPVIIIQNFEHSLLLAFRSEITADDAALDLVIVLLLLFVVFIC